MTAKWSMIGCNSCRRRLVAVGCSREEGGHAYHFASRCAGRRGDPATITKIAKFDPHDPNKSAQHLLLTYYRLLLHVDPSGPIFLEFKWHYIEAFLLD
ncbi:hypothetical protein CBM2595_A70036 [Cupriavidus taiwanensis]|nr:hypothetical protein CBM2595_A70036 [Cupriavidus taiwanensis]